MPGDFYFPRLLREPFFYPLTYSEYYGFNSYFGKSLATLDTQGFEGKKLF